MTHSEKYEAEIERIVEDQKSQHEALQNSKTSGSVSGQRKPDHEDPVESDSGPKA